ncbi:MULTISPECIES: DUF6876 family protein [unclassified Chryseobacterium]|uniref:DUF6876 family protein n=1 Tax=unclassified Chryseobacterium TaxID=2593645 RepID=UPI0028537092|nr:DUF6876 family protein [Chryseobacterium sp. CFS7]MDR4895110.1 hypothetical protein [Chryseobacterium sp. CFS7]
MHKNTDHRDPERKANDYYRHCFGTENYYQYNTGHYLTDGVKEIAENENCFWFADIICSYQYLNKFKNTQYQKWILERVKNCEFKVTASNLDDGEILITQEIPLSDFYFKELVFLKKDNIILLPSED